MPIWTPRVVWIHIVSIGSHIFIVGVTPDTVVAATCSSVVAKVPANNQVVTVHLLSRQQNPEQRWSPAGPGDTLLNSSPKERPAVLGRRLSWQNTA